MPFFAGGTTWNARTFKVFGNCYSVIYQTESLAALGGVEPIALEYPLVIKRGWKKFHDFPV